MTFEYILFLLLCILPVFYKLTFWLYTIQLKEYRLDRFREYIGTPQGKRALFNFWFFIELPLFVGSFSILLDRNFEIIIFPIVFYFLGIYNIFVLGKIFRRRLLLPKLTGRLALIALVSIIGVVFGFYYILFQDHQIWLYTYTLGLLIFFQFVIFLSILITSPLTHYKKKKLITLASSKSQSIDEVIKIGITGSYGKSSVKEFLASILEQASPHSVSPKGREVEQKGVLKTPENINTELGVSAIVLQKLNNSYKYFVAEMGAYKIGEISTLGKIVDHKHGFLTAIGNQHLALFGGMENTKKAKCEIAESVLKNNGTLYINWNNENIQTSTFDEKLNIIKYGNTEGADAKYSNIKITGVNTQFDFKYNSPLAPLLKNRGEQSTIQETFEVPLIGEHHILNITGVIACCIDLGLETSDIKKYLQHLKAPKNTLEITKIPHSVSPNGREVAQLTLIDDTYNLSEAGLIAGLGVLNTIVSPHPNPLPGGEGITRILVLDDILELGKTAGEIHFNLGKKLSSEKLVDKLLFCGVNYKKDFEKGLVEGGFEQESILKSLDDVGEGSVVLFEGRKARGYFEKIKNV